MFVVNDVGRGAQPRCEERARSPGCACPPIALRSEAWSRPKLDLWKIQAQAMLLNSHELSSAEWRSRPVVRALRRAASGTD